MECGCDNLTSVNEGANWPLVTGNNGDSYLGVESGSLSCFISGIDSKVQYLATGCGSMLVMALAHARKSGDGRLIATYYDLLRKWADFLVKNSLQLNE
jgi:hypothetical protein